MTTRTSDRLDPLGTLRACAGRPGDAVLAPRSLGVTCSSRTTRPWSAVEADPDHLEARFVAALALARSGAVGRARDRGDRSAGKTRARPSTFRSRCGKTPRPSLPDWPRTKRSRRAGRAGGIACARPRISTKRPPSSLDGSSRASTPRRCGCSRATSTGRASSQPTLRRLVEADRALGIDRGLLARGDRRRRRR